MKSCMIGLAISQFLWSSHYEMYTFFRKYLVENGERINSYLEIGPGHGLFLKNAIQYIRQGKTIAAVDISSISVKITKSMMK